MTYGFLTIKNRDALYTGSSSVSGAVQYAIVDTFADLPSHPKADDVVLIRKSTGIVLSPQWKRKGFYRYTGTTWKKTNAVLDISHALHTRIAAKADITMLPIVLQQYNASRTYALYTNAPMNKYWVRNLSTGEEAYVSTPENAAYATSEDTFLANAQRLTYEKINKQKRTL